MQSARAFAQLVRPINLLIMVLTMYAMRFLVQAPILIDDLELEEWKFGLSVLVVVLLAAAGNIINDYFDVRVDRINKPQRVVIGKGVKRRVAMAAHHGFNVVACVIGGYLAYTSRVWVLAMVPVFMAASLWFYSVQFKKQPLIGNVVVAVMVGVVPLWSGVFELLAQKRAGTVTVSYFHLDTYAWAALVAYAAFAFLLTLMREAQKDLEDVEGDSAQQFQTMPIAWGVPLTKRYVGVLGALTLLAVVACTWELSKFHENKWWWVVLSSLVLVVLPLVRSMLKTLRGSTKEDYHAASSATKWTMTGGLLMACWIYFTL